MAGANPATSALALPAAATRSEPRSVAESIADWRALEHVASTAKLMLMTFAGCALRFAPSTAPPEAHVMAAVMSDSRPPRQLRDRMGSTFAPGATPTMPSALPARAAITPDTLVPCQDDARPAAQSPGSAGSASQPGWPSVSNGDDAPSRSAASSGTSDTKSKPGTTASSRSGCAVMPVSMTATVTPVPADGS